MTDIELLAPARNAEIAIEAIKHGADAVYIGSQSHGARASASNSVNDVVQVVDFAHKFNAKVYVTLNTLVYEDELLDVESHVKLLYKAGVDALIVQDLSLLRLDIPPIALHASTQCDIRTPEKAQFLESLGFSQLVLPRELSLDEIRKIRAAVSVPVEAFVHGALCVSYSGDCQASFFTTGRSANRGECCQMCRLPYDLVDGDGRCIAKGRHLLSLRDMNRSARLREMIDAGISSFKIEGRLKDISYVKNIVAYYDNIFNQIVSEQSDCLRRSSSGSKKVKFTPDPGKTFNRGFTEYFLDGTPHVSLRMASVDTPKSAGAPVATVKRVLSRRVVEVKPLASLANGDGLTFVMPDGKLSGCRVNRVDGNRLIMAVDVDLKPGTVLRRNRDKLFDDILAVDSADRRIGIAVHLRSVASGRIVVDAKDQRGLKITVTKDYVAEPARSCQEDRQRFEFAKLGDSIYNLVEFESEIADKFIPASVLTSLRRKVVTAFNRVARMTYAFNLRHKEQFCGKMFKPAIDRHDNVANTLAKRVYEEHGATAAAMAVEVEEVHELEPVVMTTRYCLRRELGICMATPEGRNVPEPLSLVHGRDQFRVDFMCGLCGMRIRKIR